MQQTAKRAVDFIPYVLIQKKELSIDGIIVWHLNAVAMIKTVMLT